MRGDGDVWGLVLLAIVGCCGWGIYSGYRRVFPAYDSGCWQVAKLRLDSKPDTGPDAARAAEARAWLADSALVDYEPDSRCASILRIVSGPLRTAPGEEWRLADFTNKSGRKICGPVTFECPPGSKP